MAELNPYRAPLTPDQDGANLDGDVKCPECGSQECTKVNYCWWGGALAPRLFHMVKCTGCRTHYNGRTGARLTKAALIYTGVSTVIGLGLVYLYWQIR